MAGRRGWFYALIALAAFGASAYIGWRETRPPGLPADIASGAGRIELDEIDIDAKFAGAVAETLVEEGAEVRAGEVVARMDTRDLETVLRGAEAQAEAAQRGVEEALANVDQQKTQVTFAQQEYDRTSALATRGFATIELLDQRSQALAGAQAALSAASDLVGVAERAFDATAHDVELDKVNIGYGALVAPRAGRIQYRVVNVGEVLAAGARAYTMLDPSYVYMDVYLPTLIVGRARIGAQARVFLEGRPRLALPARVVFVAAQAQFTPKIVETREDRDTYMFRIRLRIDAAVASERAGIDRGGPPAVAYVKLDPAAPWPPELAPNAGP